MQGNELEEAFAAFLEETEFYEASAALRALARAAFEAGCAAAGGRHAKLRMKPQSRNR